MWKAPPSMRTMFSSDPAVARALAPDAWMEAAY
jgi:hypothetical protein